MKLDFNVMVSGLEKIRQAFKDIGWDIMPGVQEIVLAASETVKQEEFGIFQQCYDKYRSVSWLEGLKWSKQRAIRYALVSHLCLFCTEKHSVSIQEPALDLLVRLATKGEGRDWRNDERIFEAMIEAFIAIGQHNQDHETHVVNAFSKNVRVQTGKNKKIIDECLSGMSFEERIKSGYKPQEDATGRSPYDSTRQRLGLHITASIYNQNRRTLEDHYKSESFAKVTVMLSNFSMRACVKASLFEDQTEQHHIKEFEFNMAEYEKVIVFDHTSNETSQSNYNQRENNMKRTMMVKKPLDMNDLFKKRGTLRHGLHINAQRILMIGNPGTGKTCLSKRLCYDWAFEAWGSELTHVYYLPIRSLSDNRVGDCWDLPSIILKLIFVESGAQDRNKALYEEVKDNLSKSTTLLILDGYVEAGKLAMDLVFSSFTLGCFLLISSRPHSVHGIRPKVDIEVECLELSEKQLSTFIHTQLNFDNASELLEFLSQNLSIRATCCIAVNAQIITRLWNSSYKEELIKKSCANLSSFHDMISKYLWMRFTIKDNQYSMNKTFNALELVAYEAFQKGQVEIPEPLILKHAQESMNVFCASGFLLFVKEGSVFQFAHLTFHEYFAGRHLAKLLKSANGEERKIAEKFIAQHKYIETSRVMLSFMTQCYCTRDDMESNLEAFKDLLQVLESDPLPTISLQHLFLRMRTLDAFLPCGLDETEVDTNDDVILIVNDATVALENWFSDELDGDDRGVRFLFEMEELRTPIIDELERMPSLFNRFPDFLKPLLLNAHAKLYEEDDDEYHRDIARIGKLNPQYARQCIVPLLDNLTTEEQAEMIQLCTLIGPICAEPTLDHLKKLSKVRETHSQITATTSLAKFLELFPERKDVRQLVVDASRDLSSNVRYTLVVELGFITFTPEDEASTFVWDLLIEAMKDNDLYVRGLALRSCVRLYQRIAKSVDEVMELISEFVASPDFNNDLTYAAYAIEDLIQKIPEKEEELLALMKAMCRDVNKHLRYSAFLALKGTIKRSCLKREVLFNVAFDVFKDGYPDVQLELLPFIFSFDKKEEDGLDKVNQFIANCQDLNEKVREKAISCREVNTLLSNYTIEEIHEKFYDQDKEVQVEVVAQFDLREIESNKTACAIAEMAVHCLRYNDFVGTSKSLLAKFSKTELFPRAVLEKLAEIGYATSNYVRNQPLSHILEYYWITKNSNMIRSIAEKLLLSSVIFEKKGETETEVSFREKGANVKQTAPVEVVEELLSRCKGYLKEEYGLDFRHDDAFYSDEESESHEKSDFYEESESD